MVITGVLVMKPAFVVSNDNEGRVRFQLKSSSGDVLLESKSYRTMCAAERAIESVRDRAENLQNFKQVENALLLMGRNGQAIGSCPKLNVSDAPKWHSKFASTAADAEFIDTRPNRRYR